MHERILVVDDEPEIVSLVKEALESAGYRVDTAGTVREAQALAETQPDLILLDVMMPGSDGYELCQAMRKVVSCPILFLSAKDREVDRVKGLSVGGDDYLVKPFSLQELRARIHAHLRREQRANLLAQRSIIPFGELLIDVTGHQLTFRKEAIPCTQREFAILSLLAIHQGQIFSREKIYERVWGIDAVGDDATVTEHIKKIRAKLACFEPDLQCISNI